MNDYYDLLQLFYNEKHLYLTNKDKYLKCHDCPNNKLFTEKSAEIILSCGEHSDTAKCGNKIRILLPIHSSIKDLNYFKNKLEEMINWKTIKQYIDVDEKLINDNKSIQSKYEKEVSKLQELFNKINVKDKPQRITDNYNIITSLRSKCDNILIQLRDPDEVDKKKQLMKQYIDNINKINELYKVSKELNDDFQEYYLIQDPEIVVPENVSNYKEIMEQNKEKKKSKKKSKKKDKKDKKSKKDKEAVVEDVPAIVDEGEPIEFAIEEDLHDEVVSAPEIKIKVGDNVKWTVNGKELTGIVESKSHKKYKICCKPGKVSGDKQSIYQVDKDKVSLNVMVDEEPNDSIEGPDEAVEEPNEAVEEPNEAVEGPDGAVEEPNEAVEEPDEAVEEPNEAVEEPDEAAEEPNEALTEPVKIKTGDSVKWTDDNGKELTGIVESKSPKKYKICCKPGKESGDKQSVYQVNRDKVSLN
mgnify:CR=1 FL=1